MNTEKIIDEIISSLQNATYLRADEMPNIELYMDQVTTFLEKNLDKDRRYPEDKIMTKTMINNYAKNKLLPPPDKKKYSRDHMIMLIFIYYFKNILTISDIDKLLSPLSEKYFGKAKGADTLTLEEIYERIFSLTDAQTRAISRDITEKFRISRECFEVSGSTDDTERLRYFAFICMLSFDVYVKKKMIQRLIDHIPPEK